MVTARYFQGTKRGYRSRLENDKDLTRTYPTVEPTSNRLRSFVEIRARADWAIVPSAIHAHLADQLRETRKSQTSARCPVSSIEGRPGEHGAGRRVLPA